MPPTGRSSPRWSRSSPMRPRPGCGTRRGAVISACRASGGGAGQRPAGRAQAARPGASWGRLRVPPVDRVRDPPGPHRAEEPVARRTQPPRPGQPGLGLPALHWPHAEWTRREADVIRTTPGSSTRPDAGRHLHTKPTCQFCGSSESHREPIAAGAGRVQVVLNSSRAAQSQHEPTVATAASNLHFADVR